MSVPAVPPPGLVRPPATLPDTTMADGLPTLLRMAGAPQHAAPAAPAQIPSPAIPRAVLLVAAPADSAAPEGAVRFEPGETVQLQLLAAKVRPDPPAPTAASAFPALPAGRTEAGERIVSTPFGPMILEGAAEPQPGMRLVLLPMPGRQAAAPPAPVAVTVVRIVPAEGSTPARPVEALMLRAAGPIPAHPAIEPALGGTFPALAIVTAAGGDTVLATPFGLAALAPGPAADARTGAPFLLRLLDELPAAGPLPRESGGAVLGGLGQRWPALQAAVVHLLSDRPELGAALLQAVPQPGPELLRRLARYMEAVRKGDMEHWLDEDGPASDAVDDAVPGLRGDFERLSRLAEPGPDWRTFLVPFFDGREFQQIRLFVRSSDGEEPSGDDADEPRRFLLELDLSRLGPLQLDGFCRRRQVSLVFRSKRRLPPGMADDLRRIFLDGAGALGLSGDLRFEVGERFSGAARGAVRSELEIDV